MPPGMPPVPQADSEFGFLNDAHDRLESNAPPGVSDNATKPPAVIPWVWVGGAVGLLLLVALGVLLLQGARNESSQASSEADNSQVGLRIMVAEYNSHTNQHTLRRPSALKRDAGNLAIDRWKVTKIGESFYLCEAIATPVFMSDKWTEPARTIFELRNPWVEVRYRSMRTE